MSQCRTKARRPNTSRRFWVRIGATGMLLAIVWGCRQEVELGGVEGIVTLDGAPLPDATIRFVPVNGGRSALGRTDAAGRYEMQYSASAEGALVGPMRVEITVAEEEEVALGRTRMKPELIPEKFNVNSILTAEVLSGNNTYDFEITSK